MTARSRFFRAELWETSYFLRTELRVVASAKQAKYKRDRRRRLSVYYWYKDRRGSGNDVRRTTCLVPWVEYCPLPLTRNRMVGVGLFFSRVRRISGKLDTLKNVAAKKKRNKVSVQIKTTGFVVLFITWPPPLSAIKAFRRFLEKEKEVRRRICVPGGLCCAMTNDDQANFDDERNISSSISFNNLRIHFTICRLYFDIYQYHNSIMLCIDRIREWFEDSDAIRYISTFRFQVETWFFILNNVYIVYFFLLASRSFYSALYHCETKAKQK